MFFQVEITKQSNSYKINLGFWVIRCIRHDTLKGVGKAFGIDKNSTVGSVVERVKREMEKNKNISKRVENLKDILEKS